MQQQQQQQQRRHHVNVHVWSNLGDIVGQLHKDNKLCVGGAATSSTSTTNNNTAAAARASKASAVADNAPCRGGGGRGGGGGGGGKRLLLLASSADASTKKNKVDDYSTTATATATETIDRDVFRMFLKRVWAEKWVRVSACEEPFCSHGIADPMAYVELARKNAMVARVGFVARRPHSKTKKNDNTATAKGATTIGIAFYIAPAPIDCVPWSYRATLRYPSKTLLDVLFEEEPESP